MNTIGIMLFLRPGCFDEYRRRHDELWPDLCQLLSEHGVQMAIFRDGDRLYVVGAVPDPESWAKIAASPVNARWDNYMAEVLQTDDQGRIIRQPLEPAFLFGKFLP